MLIEIMILILELLRKYNSGEISDNDVARELFEAGCFDTMPGIDEALAFIRRFTS